MKKRILSVILMLMLALSSFTACGSSSDEEVSTSFSSKFANRDEEDEDEDDDDRSDSMHDKGGRSSRSSKNKKDDKSKKDNDVIVAKSIDTSSEYAFEIKTALIGTDSYDYDQFLVLCIGEFTNNSDEIMDFSSIVNVEVRQDGIELDKSYSASFSKLNYAQIKPGESIPIVLGYEVITTSDIEITCTDYTHYAKEVLCHETYSIEELCENTDALISEYEQYIEDDYNDDIDEFL